MNNIRKIIAERLEKIEYEYELISAGKLKNTLSGQIEAYQDCLNLIPAPRTEQEILKDFEKLGWKTHTNTTYAFSLKAERGAFIQIWKSDKSYKVDSYITMQEHKLLSELFEVIFNE